ncbi:hypothetical protein Phum_PHUM090350 [Pediculus humanus corporis]|uniref:Apple domain-containing protein n=1 Tax=Pediculus humanus subsp. corporis TaxID=121224 RepID=E0VCL9_PEDHC|nr:uncharacterized protein Phum_PHUM090350 [Pediculus humanus corporis]EEB11125.1 hypothetical protein Phum_PHUM090350 [Pediculus humanus corporis]
MNLFFIHVLACYRRVVSGKRLHERFIRHSLPCNSLEACQHQCSIEKRFDCQGFNIRLDLEGVGRGICELSSFTVGNLDQYGDFVYDPEFAYYERLYGIDSPNCGLLYHNIGRNEVVPNHQRVFGGPYYGGDSYGPWSTGFGTTNYGPWGDHGYGSGFYVSNNPSRGPTPSFQPEFFYSDKPYGRPYGYGDGSGGYGGISVGYNLGPSNYGRGPFNYGGSPGSTSGGPGSYEGGLSGPGRGQNNYPSGPGITNGGSGSYGGGPGGPYRGPDNYSGGSGGSNRGPDNYSGGPGDTNRGSSYGGGSSGPGRGPDNYPGGPGGLNRGPDYYPGGPSSSNGGPNNYGGGSSGPRGGANNYQGGSGNYPGGSGGPIRGPGNYPSGPGGTNRDPGSYGGSGGPIRGPENYPGGPGGINRGPGNYGGGSDGSYRGPDNYSGGPGGPNTGPGSYGGGSGGPSRGPDIYSGGSGSNRGPDNYQGGSNNYRGGSGGPNGGPDNYSSGPGGINRGSGSYGGGSSGSRGPDNYPGSPGATNGDSGNYRGGSGPYRGPDNYSGGSGPYRSPDNYSGGSGGSRRGPDNYPRGPDSPNRGPDSYRRGPGGPGGTSDNYPSDPSGNNRGPGFGGYRGDSGDPNRNPNYYAGDSNRYGIPNPYGTPGNYGGSGGYGGGFTNYRGGPVIYGGTGGSGNGPNNFEGPNRNFGVYGGVSIGSSSNYGNGFGTYGEITGGFRRNGYDSRNSGKVPTYIIIDADVNDRNREKNPNNYKTSTQNFKYLPPKIHNLSPKEQNTASFNFPSTPSNSLRNPNNFSTPSQYSPTISNNSPPQSTLGPQPIYTRPSPSTPPLPSKSNNLSPPIKDTTIRPHVYSTRPQELPSRPPSSYGNYPQTQLQPNYYVPNDYSTHRVFGSSRKFNDGFHVIENEVCFQRAHPGYRLDSTSIKKMFDAPSVLECEAMCTSSSFKCTGYSFRYSTGSGGAPPNCLLTDFSSLTLESDLFPDRSCDVYFKMSSCLNVERISSAECFLKVASNRKMDTNKIAKSLWVQGISECELACLNSGYFTCRTFSFRHGSRVIGESNENCFLSDWPVTAFSLEDFLFSPNHEIYERGSFGHGCELDVGTSYIGPGPPLKGYPEFNELWSVGDTWRHFTVSGWPCKIGTECTLNPLGGFWSCPVEGGTADQWDYCCRPKHACGYSRGYNYPWCYVGEAGPQQWRPCSEQYYPEFDNRFENKPAQGYIPHPAHSFEPHSDTRPWISGDDEYDFPIYWPISYLYSEPPPNETIYWEDDDEHVIDDDEYYFHHDHHHFADALEHHILEEEQEGEKYSEESPVIRFKPHGHKVPYPKVVVQKLDHSNNNIIKHHQDGNDDDDDDDDRDKKFKKTDSSLKVPISDVILEKYPKDNSNNNNNNNYNNETEKFNSRKRGISNVTDYKNITKQKHSEYKLPGLIKFVNDNETRERELKALKTSSRSPLEFSSRIKNFTSVK